jgi:hypothetical protein
MTWGVCSQSTMDKCYVYYLTLNINETTKLTSPKLQSFLHLYIGNQPFTWVCRYGNLVGGMLEDGGDDEPLWIPFLTLLPHDCILCIVELNLSFLNYYLGGFLFHLAFPRKGQTKELEKHSPTLFSTTRPFSMKVG